MRIIAGKYRGRRLLQPKAGIRPTTDRLRESLFNVLGDSVVGTVWLDLFAGTGAVGLEALSRGARLAVFNDTNPEAARLVARNLERCGINEGFEIFERDALTLLNRLRGRQFDFVSLDPPYAYPRYDKLLAKIAETLAPSPTVILEVFKKTSVDFVHSPWGLERTLKAGDSHLLLMRPSNEPT